jgi:hypothetical protein
VTGKLTGARPGICEKNARGGRLSGAGSRCKYGADPEWILLPSVAEFVAQPYSSRTAAQNVIDSEIPEKRAAPNFACAAGRGRGAR